MNINMNCWCCDLQCLWCKTNSKCVPYPTGGVLPKSSLCSLSEARWGVCWGNSLSLSLSLFLSVCVSLFLSLCSFLFHIYSVLKWVELDNILKIVTVFNWLSEFDRQLIYRIMNLMIMCCAHFSVNFEALIIAMGVIGGIILLAITVCICCCCCCKKNNKNKWANLLYYYA